MARSARLEESNPQSWAMVNTNFPGANPQIAADSVID